MQDQDRPSQYIKEIHDLIYNNLTRDELLDWIKLLEYDKTFRIKPMFENAVDVYVFKIYN